MYTAQPWRAVGGVCVQLSCGELWRGVYSSALESWGGDGVYNSAMESRGVGWGGVYSSAVESGAGGGGVYSSAVGGGCIQLSLGELGGVYTAQLWRAGGGQCIQLSCGEPLGGDGVYSSAVESHWEGDVESLLDSLWSWGLAEHCA